MNTLLNSLPRSLGRHLGLGASAGFFFSLYFSTFHWLLTHDWKRDDYSHGILIPFIFLYLVWEKRKELSRLPDRPTALGLCLVIQGLVLFWLGELAGEFFILYISAWLIFTGVLWVHLGWEKIRKMAFALCLLPTMFPLPDLVTVKLTFKLRLLSSKLGLAMLQGAGMSAFREGNIIDLGFTRLQVVDACSGLRYLFPMIILSILLVYFSRTALWKKALVVFSSVPLTIFTNALRIALTGILSERYGAAAVEGFFHDFEGWLIFMVTLGALVVQIKVLNRLFPGGAPSPAPVPEVSEPGAKNNGGILFPLVTILLLGLTLAVSQEVEFRAPVEMARGFEAFPMEIGPWKGIRRTMEEKFILALDLSDYILADYQDAQGRTINFYAAYYQSQQKGESIHSPATCLRGGGWRFEKNRRELVPLDSGPPLPVNRSLLRKGNQEQICYFWFPMRGRNLTNAYEMKWFNFWDALTLRRTDGALVRIIAPLGRNESPAQAEMRLKDFLNRALPVLSSHLPSGDLNAHL